MRRGTDCISADVFAQHVGPFLAIRDIAIARQVCRAWGRSRITRDVLGQDVSDARALCYFHGSRVRAATMFGTLLRSAVDHYLLHELRWLVQNADRLDESASRKDIVDHLRRIELEQAFISATTTPAGAALPMLRILDGLRADDDAANKGLANRALIRACNLPHVVTSRDTMAILLRHGDPACLLPEDILAATSHKDRTLAAVACRAGNLVALRALVNDGHTVPWVTCDSLRAAMHAACRRGHAHLIEFLLTDARAREMADPAIEHSLPLRAACANNRVAIVKMLLDDGRADPSALGSNTLYLATRDDVIKMLLDDKRADPTVNESAAFRLACHYNRVACVALFLRDGRADPTANRNEAMRAACENGFWQIVQLLLADGRADPTCCVRAVVRNEDCYRRIATLIREDARVKKKEKEVQHDY